MATLMAVQNALSVNLKALSRSSPQNVSQSTAITIEMASLTDLVQVASPCAKLRNGINSARKV